MEHINIEKKISIFGSTGSIGQSTVEILTVSNNYNVIALTGGKNIKKLADQARRLNAKIVVTSVDSLYQELKELMAGTKAKVLAGKAGIMEAADLHADIFVSAIIGFSGLAPSIRCLKHGSVLALANKESLVVAGSLLKKESKRHGAKIIPIDSEHSGIFQLLSGNDLKDIEKITITASGGSFRAWPPSKLETVTLEQAGKHPNWNMGLRITIDSNSMFNKAMELIETKELFDVNHEKIDVLIHPESVVHAMIGFSDGGILAHLSKCDMKHAISYALNWPNRASSGIGLLDLSEISTLNFEKLSEAKFPALRIAREVLKNGGLSGVVFNASKEVALDRFILNNIKFNEMSHIVERTLDNIERSDGISAMEQNLEGIIQMNRKAREVARNLTLR